MAIGIGTAFLAALGAGLLAAAGAHADDIELTAPGGRRVLLKDDGTWRYADGPAADSRAADAEPGAREPEGEALLSLEGKIEGNRICRLQLRMLNQLPYEIRSLVPEFVVYRHNGIVYDSVFSGFSFIKPGDSQRREVRFNGIDCKDIGRVQVTGGDRCEMGDLDKFSPGRGMCLARVRVSASELMPFVKQAPDGQKPQAPAAGSRPAPEPAGANRAE